MKEHQDNLLDYRAVSEMTGLPIGTIYSLVFRRQIPHIRLGKRLVRFSFHRIAAWIKSQEVNPQISKSTSSPMNTEDQNGKA